MPMQEMPNESDTLASLQSLGNYLKSEITVTSGVKIEVVKERPPSMARKLVERRVEHRCHNIVVTIRNAAPTEPK